MIFQHTLDLVLSGEKTQTRRVISSSEQALRGRYNQITTVVTSGRDKWRVESTYAVQPARGCPQVARIKITSIRSQIVKYITTADALAEGFESRNDFLAVWRRIHGNNSLDYRVWIVGFEIVAFVAEKQNHIIRQSLTPAAYANYQ